MLSLFYSGRQIIEENPDITSDELQERMALWEVNKNRPAVTQSVAIKPVESAKGIIYGDERTEVTESRNNSRRNQGTFSLGEYNYFKEDNGR